MVCLDGELKSLIHYFRIIERRKIHMSNVKWTKEQMQAIEEKNSNILVAAAARKWKNCCFG